MRGPYRGAGLASVVICAAVSLGNLLLGQSNDQGDRVVYQHPSSHWFEAPQSRVEIATDGQWALFRRSPAPELANLRTGLDASRLQGSLDGYTRATFCGSRLLRFGRRGTVNGWFFEDEVQPQVDVPPDALIRCSPDGQRLAYVRASRPDELVIRSTGAFSLDGRVTTTAFAPDGAAVYALVFGASGVSTLVRIDPKSKDVTSVVAGLDAARDDRGLAISVDGRAAYLPLASAGVPDAEARHRPHADRWLKIYRLDLATSARHLVVESAQDNHSPVIVDESLYWVRNITSSAVSVLASEGGAVKHVVAGEMPSWSPDGRRVSFVTGGWRLADWALNLDAAVIEVGETNARPVPIVTGYHEDFAAAWSPNGRWIAYHSHRSAIPVSEYGAAGGSDDIYLRRADNGDSREIRLTDFGWEAGSPDWSPDSRKLLFTSYQKGGAPGQHKPFVLSLAPETGELVGVEALPLAEEIRNPQMAAWSPDGLAIAVEDHRGGFDRTLWVVKTDGSAPRRITDYRATSYGGVDWKADGETLIFAALANERMQLFSVAMGGTPKQITDDPGNLRHPQVSPDGEWIAATRLEQSHQIMMRPLPN